MIDMLVIVATSFACLYACFRAAMLDGLVPWFTRAAQAEAAPEPAEEAPPRGVGWRAQAAEPHHAAAAEPHHAPAAGARRTPAAGRPRPARRR